MDANAGPSKAANAFSKVLKEELFKGATLPAGFGISSHSMRKTMCSAAIAAGADRTKVMAWGGWTSEKAMEPYINPDYVATEFSKKVFDWLM